MTDSLRRPKALLLDFGGVIVAAPAMPLTPVELVTRIQDLTGGAVSDEQMERDLIDGVRAYDRWRDSVSDQNRPSELSHAQVFDDFITTTWPEAAREQVRREATTLCYAWTYRRDWEVLPGIPELLDTADAAGVPCAIVSNTLCGTAHRDFLASAGLGARFAAQIYSDEIGIRKPNPEFIRAATRELTISNEDCWLVGDSLSRDIACARRANCGAAILVHSARTNRERSSIAMRADVALDNSCQLPALFMTWAFH